LVITLRDVARRAGVSAMTASRVINGRTGVGAETQRRVEEAIAALDYVPNRIARGLVSQKTQTIGLVVPDAAGHVRGDAHRLAPLKLDDLVFELELEPAGDHEVQLLLSLVAVPV